MKKMINFLAGLALCIISGQALGMEKVPSFTKEEASSSNGATELQWDHFGLEEGEFYEVQEFDNSADVPMGVVYKGHLPSAFLSGLENGIYFFKVRIARSDGLEHPWSESIKINVKHHSLQFAFMLFALGAIVVLATVVVIFRGAK